MAKVKEWCKWNPTINTVEIITCNSRHSSPISKKLADGSIETSWVKPFTDQIKRKLQRENLTVKALPMGMGSMGEHQWSILKFSNATNTWLYVTADGATDNDFMWPGVLAVEQDLTFKSSKNYVTAGKVVMARETSRKYTLDFGTIADLRDRLVTLA